MSEPRQQLPLQPARIERLGDSYRVGHLARRLSDVGPDRDRPVGQLVPRQQVSGERQAQRDDQQAQPDQPIELARAAVRAGVERPHHVQQHGHHHHVGRPAVDVADEPARRHDEVDVLDRIVRHFGIGFVVEHQQHTGHQRDQERGCRTRCPVPSSWSTAGSSGESGPGGCAGTRSRTRTASACGRWSANRCAARLAKIRRGAAHRSAQKPRRADFSRGDSFIGLPWFPSARFLPRPRQSRARSWSPCAKAAPSGRGLSSLPRRARTANRGTGIRNRPECS
jgi:hypothetical protein